MEYRKPGEPNEASSWRSKKKGRFDMAKRRRRRTRQTGYDLQAGNIQDLFKGAQGFGKYFSTKEKTKRMQAKLAEQRKKRELKALEAKYNEERKRLQAESKEKWKKRYQEILATQKSLGHKTRRGIGKLRKKIGRPEHLY